MPLVRAKRCSTIPLPMRCSWARGKSRPSVRDWSSVTPKSSFSSITRPSPASRPGSFWIVRFSSWKALAQDVSSTTPASSWLTALARRPRSPLKSNGLGKSLASPSSPMPLAMPIERLKWKEILLKQKIIFLRAAPSRTGRISTSRPNDGVRTWPTRK